MDAAISSAAPPIQHSAADRINGFVTAPRMRCTAQEMMISFGKGKNYPSRRLVTFTHNFNELGNGHSSWSSNRIITPPGFGQSHTGSLRIEVGSGRSPKSTVECWMAFPSLSTTRRKRRFS